jgi:hypothetical protein
MLADDLNADLKSDLQYENADKRNRENEISSPCNDSDKDRPIWIWLAGRVALPRMTSATLMHGREILKWRSNRPES